MRTIRTFQLAAILLLFLSMSACRTAREPLRPEPIGALPPVPSVDGELEITLVHPPPGQTRPDVDSTFVFGDVGTGEAELTINGELVPVARNGAFLAYVPVPSDGTYTLVARANGERATKTYRYREEEIRPPQPVPVVPPRLAFVRSEGRDTVDTGSETAYALTSPNGRRLMFMLPETPLRVTGRLSNHYRVELGAERSAWVPEAALVLTDSVAGSWPAIETLEVRPAPDYVDVRIGGGHPSFIVHADAKSVSLSVFGLDARHAPVLRAEDPWIESAALTGASADSLHIRLELSSPLWGYKAFHDDEGALVVRLRRPPSVDAAQPLAGLRIVVDPGHPPAGATGPKGLPEAEANLRIALPLRDLLEQRGATVLMTRIDDSPMVSRDDVAAELWARTRFAVEEDADLLVSIHNNAFPDGVNPFRHHGAEVYYFHEMASELAGHLVREIADVTGTPEKGAIQRSLALVRPSWMPAVLTESLYMMFPQQEAALRSDEFVQRLAEAHARGILRFVEARLAR